jgi:hypothetical protein
MGKVGYSKQLLKEFVLFARQNKVYWVLPLVLLLLAAAVVIVGSTSVAPFVYTLF